MKITLGEMLKTPGVWCVIADDRCYFVEVADDLVCYEINTSTQTLERENVLSRTGWRNLDWPNALPDKYSISAVGPLQRKQVLQ